MAKYSLIHVGINCENTDEAMKSARIFELMFGFKTRETAGAVFAGTEVECMKTPGPGKNGHIGIGVDNITDAMEELKAKGFSFDESSAKYNEKGEIFFIYLTEEICGFAVHIKQNA